MQLLARIFLFLSGMTTCLVVPAFANGVEEAVPSDYTRHIASWACLGVFILGYILVITEEIIHLRKSKPVLVAAGLIWILVGWLYSSVGRSEEMVEMLRHNLLEFAELLLFLLAAMTYINVLDERNVFQGLRAKLVSRGFSLRILYWMTGVIAFFMSPIADNLTTALIMGTVVMAVGAGYPAFISVALINIVVAVNAGGAFSPFGDITTLMVWQDGLVKFFEFFRLFIPALVSWVIPSFLMSFAVPKGIVPDPMDERVKIKKGGFFCLVLFLATIASTVLMQHMLHLPPFLGMMMGLGVLTIYAYFIRRYELVRWVPMSGTLPPGTKPERRPFDIFISIKRVEWDTLLFFYGIILSVGGLGACGYLAVMSDSLYEGLSTTTANVLIGILSAIVDNIPVMFAVISMNPEMSHGQWLLATLTVGVGGSLLSIGSAAGVALMGQSRGVYTFMSHLKWAWAVALGYAASIWTHLFLNAQFF